MSIILTILILLNVTFLIRADVPTDLIDSLPGINYKINFKQYSGYLQPDDVNYFHYWLVESQGSPSNDSLVLWLNGGPGCSSLFGLLYENGPFVVSDINETLIENVYSWNKVANVLYLESPAGIGFSYATDRNITFGDNQTAILNYNSLLDFFDKFSEFKGRDFYIAGESYGGVYLPMLADLIIQNKTLLPNFKGVAIGNGYLTKPLLINSLIPFMYMHLLVGEDLWSKLTLQCKQCNGNPMKCDYHSILQSARENRTWSDCVKLILIIAHIPTLVRLDPYNLYDTCYVDTSVQSDKMQIVEYKEFLRNFDVDYETIRDMAIENGMDLSEFSDETDAQEYPECYYNGGYSSYLRRSDVRAAIHIPDFVPHWRDCNDTVSLKYKRQYSDQTQHLQTIFDANVTVMCYNGDVDTVCNALGDQRYIHELGRQQINRTKAWRYKHDTYEVAGWETRYNGIDFLTVRGSGHYVPHDKPREALQMFTNFIRGVDYSAPTGIDVSPQPLLSSSGNRFDFISSSVMCLMLWSILVILFSSV